MTIRQKVEWAKELTLAFEQRGCDCTVQHDYKVLIAYQSRQSSVTYLTVLKNDVEASRAKQDIAIEDFTGWYRMTLRERIRVRV